MAQRLQANARVLVLEVSKVLLGNEVQGPDQTSNTHKHPGQGGVVDAQREADTVTVEAVVDLQHTPARQQTGAQRSERQGPMSAVRRLQLRTLQCQPWPARCRTAEQSHADIRCM